MRGITRQLCGRSTISRLGWSINERAAIAALHWSFAPAAARIVYQGLFRTPDRKAFEYGDIKSWSSRTDRLFGYLASRPVGQSARAVGQWAVGQSIDRLNRDWSERPSGCRDGSRQSGVIKSNFKALSRSAKLSCHTDASSWGRGSRAGPGFRSF